MSKKQVPVHYIHPFHAVIFGGNGDLAMRKIYPALYHRAVDDQFQVDFKLIAITRNAISFADFNAQVSHFIQIATGEDEIPQINSFLSAIQLIHIPENTVDAYAPLFAAIQEAPEWQTVYYLSTPSAAFGEISDTLKKCKLINSASKVVLEKPLGNSLSSSKEIHAQISRSFRENQIYRIDHYLGKETVQNLMVLRFANHLFEQAWSAQHIDSVQITVAESLGVEDRGDYYDKSGALLDMVQNHLLQLLCLIAMEPPNKLLPDDVRNEKLKVLRALRLIDAKQLDKHVVTGQYTRGKVAGKEVSSYLEDIKAYQSNTETFVAIQAYIDNWRWKNTPFYLRTGKRMPKRYSEIIINFKSVLHNVFDENDSIPGNRLIIRLQPEERIELVQMTKVPGPGGYRYKPISLKLDYMDSFSQRLPDAYERLLVDVLRGNQTLFMRQDELEAAWIWIESITSCWYKQGKKNVLYEAGSWGPGDAIMNEHHKWSKSVPGYED